MADIKTENQKDKKANQENKGERLDRMESQMELLEAGILILINAMWWLNATITPIGTHNPDVKMEEFETLADAVEEDQKEDN